MTSRLQLYNDALAICGERKLASLTENREPRYLLDLAWDGGAIDRCLELGQWSFAMRSVEIAADASSSPAFGYQNAFSRPDDFVRVAAVCSDEYFKEPLLEYAQEGRYWYADIDPLYVKYVSNDDTYGNDLALWPPAFSDMVAAYLATKIINKLTGKNKTQIQIAEREFELNRKQALSFSAMEGPSKQLPPGSWVRARSGSGGRGPFGDGGSTGSLVG